MADEQTLQDEPLAVPVLCKGGIQRDGTTFDADGCIDGEWVRWVGDRARKIPGYRRINRYLFGPVRATSEFTKDSATYLHFGSASRIQRLQMDTSLNTSVITDRTPTSGFTANANNIWQFAVDHSTAGVPQLIAQVAHNLDCMCSSAGGALYSGDLFGTGVLTQITTLPAAYSLTGGVMALHPYTVVYGSNGFVMWSIPGDPTDYTGSGAGYAYPTRQKILKGLPLRSGASNSPAALLWSTDSLLMMTFTGGTGVFSFSTLSTSISVWAPNTIVEMDGTYYWVGAERFMSFNGIVRELPNTVNADFFFEGANSAQRQKTYAFTVPRFGEVWWCYARGTSEEPNHAIVFNTRTGAWYDTPLPGGGRTAAINLSVLRRPLLVGAEAQNAILDSVAVSAAGTGYVAGDVLTLVGGTSVVDAQVTVATVNGGGGITGLTIANAGEYTTAPSGALATTGGTGSSGTVTGVFITPYKLWAHETGLDAVDGLDTMPIRSFFETCDLVGPLREKYGMAATVSYIIPDFVQTGEMGVTVTGRANARASEEESSLLTFAAPPVAPAEQLVDLKAERRELRMRFESNVVGGDYRQGRTIAGLRLGDARLTW